MTTNQHVCIVSVLARCNSCANFALLSSNAKVGEM